MVIPFIALIVIIVGIIAFMSKAAKRKSEGKDLGETGRVGSR
jgi:glucose uptake protein GlcU